GASERSVGACATGCRAPPRTVGSNPDPIRRRPMGYPVHLVIDGQQHELIVDPRTTLLDALRDHLGNTSPKKGCDHGQCGACTVLIDGRRLNSCLALAVSVDGAEVITSDGLAPDGELSGLHQAFLDQDAFQCGYCTPGQICS